MSELCTVNGIIKASCQTQLTVDNPGLRYITLLLCVRVCVCECEVKKASQPSLLALQ